MKSHDNPLIPIFEIMGKAEFERFFWGSGAAGFGTGV
jgi:hypothetical protein